MARIKDRTYSSHTREALLLLGQYIRLARKSRKVTTAELAERIGISRGTLQRIEKGDPKVEVGLVFEAATVAGVFLFEDDSQRLAGLAAPLARARDQLSLLPNSVRHQSSSDVKDDF